MISHLLKNEHLNKEMQVFDTIKELQAAISIQKGTSKKVGFVPTMGALHKGHLSLVELALKENEVVVVSIFVNPTQFNNPDDLKNYPRTLESDLELLKDLSPDFVFAPAVDEIYPAKGIVKPAVNLGLLEKTLEGKHRPGHFNGVVQVVAGLFEIVQPDKAYFGSKDFQQLAVIKEMTRQLKLPIEIRSGETIRDADGLAMSSRNVLLSAEQRSEASGISKALFYIRDNWKVKSAAELCLEAIRRIEKNGLMKVEYLELADSNSLETIHSFDQSPVPRIFTAVQVGKVRLIDNIGIIKADD